MIGVLVVWLALCAIVGVLAGNKGRSGWGFFFLSILISPLIGFIIVLASRNSEQLVRDGESVQGLRKCPFCAESVRSEAIKCKHCGSDIVDGAEKPVQPMTREEYNRVFNVDTVGRS